MSVLNDKMFYGLKKMLSDKTNITSYSEHDAISGVEYLLISNATLSTVSPNAGSSTYVGQFNIDYYSNSTNKRIIRNQKSKVVEALADNVFYHTTSTHYYFDGELIDVEDGEDEDEYLFRIIYNIKHTKVS